MSTSQTSESIPVYDYVRNPGGAVSGLAHEWELWPGVRLSPAEDRTMVREPAHAVPAGLAERLGKVRILVVPFVACSDAGDAVCFSKPSGESHTAVWAEGDERTSLVLACRELDAHDTGFELLASIAQMALSKISSREMGEYAQLIEDEIQRGVPGEIDKDAFDAKKAYLKKCDPGGAKAASQLSQYLDVSLVSTLAEYMHGLWHDVQIRVGPDYLPVAQLQKRMIWLSGVFPPNPGYNLFAREIEGTEPSES